MISSLIFISLLAVAFVFFAKRILFIKRNILLGQKLKISDNSPKRWQLMLSVAIGQSKMVKRPLAGIMHIFVYVGFLLVNIEMLEIMLDGVFHTHRLFSFMGGFYSFLINSFEFFAMAVIVACVVFLVRRNVGKLKRFHSAEMTKGPKSDANIILFTEIALMSAFLVMNASDALLQNLGSPHYVATGSFYISSQLMPLFQNLSEGTLIFIERFAWWFHITGVLVFMNYVTYSKHLHIFLAFPNVYYSKLTKIGHLPSMESVRKEVELMMSDPYAAPANDAAQDEPAKFGASDVHDFSWKTLLDAYTCTECGRCTSVCPANLTGKKLSPRKLLMDVRDRSEEIGKQMDIQKADYKSDQKSLLSYIASEEIWACTTCNACAVACPVNINHTEIIYSLRRYLVMEQSSAPASLNNCFKNIENNGAPWQFSPEDRLLWAEE